MSKLKLKIDGGSFACGLIAAGISAGTLSVWWVPVALLCLVSHPLCVFKAGKPRQPTP